MAIPTAGTAATDAVIWLLPDIPKVTPFELANTMVPLPAVCVPAPTPFMTLLAGSPKANQEVPLQNNQIQSYWLSVRVVAPSMVSDALGSIVITPDPELYTMTLKPTPRVAAAVNAIEKLPEVHSMTWELSPATTV